MGALRCSSCSLNWPHDHEHYTECPGCGAKTDYMPSASAMAAVEAQSRVAHLNFERWSNDEDAEARALREATWEAAQDARTRAQETTRDEFEAIMEESLSEWDREIFDYLNALMAERDASV